MLFIAFGGEETGLLGSGHFVHRDQQIPLANMSFVLNLDLLGAGSDKGVNAIILLLPESKRGLVALTNGDNGRKIVMGLIGKSFEIR